jgi:O-acetyl-ADP-ribose deacetylase (regulator of RNase III)
MARSNGWGPDRERSIAMEATFGNTRIVLVQEDITRQSVDAVVNAANSSLMGGGGVDGAIHRAGGPKILAECKEIVTKAGRLPAGRAVITTGGDLPARWVIHTVGPVWRGGNQNEAETLASAYRESLRLAEDYGIRSLAFPSISTGAYGYPISDAALTAIRTVADHVKSGSGLREVRFVLFSERDLGVYEKALEGVLSE